MSRKIQFRHLVALSVEFHVNESAKIMFKTEIKY